MKKNLTLLIILLGIYSLVSAQTKPNPNLLLALVTIRPCKHLMYYPPQRALLVLMPAFQKTCIFRADGA